MWWEKAGAQNTDGTVEAAVNRGRELGIKHIVVASCSGETLKKVMQKADGFSLVCVTHHNGFEKPGENEMAPQVRRSLEQAGIPVLTTTHVLAGVDRAVRNQFGGVYPAEIMAQTLRLFGQGVKVAVEISVMALDAGLIPFDQEIISIGGSAQGADAAIVVKPAHANRFFDTEIREIICMPRIKQRV